jgi:hypothetical protein
MVSALVLCHPFLALLPSAPAAANVPRPEELSAYRQAVGRAGRDPDANVRLALWCEANGLRAERLRHLAAALDARPGHATAHGLLGQVADDGRWRRPEEFADAVRSDAALTAALAEYNTRRAAMPRPETADAHWALGLWCERQGLAPEAAAHFTAVTRLAPQRADAWRKLGCRLYRGRWVSETEAAAEESEAQAQRRADSRWGQRVRRWWEDWLARKDDEGRSRSLAEFGDDLDARAVPTVRTLFAAGPPRQQLVAVGLFDRIDAPQASRELAMMVAAGRSPDVRAAAAEALSRRDPNEAVDPLIDLLRDPLKVTVLPGNGRGVVGQLDVEDEQAIRRKVYVQKTIRSRDTQAGRLGSMGWLSAVVRPPATRGPTAEQKLRRDAQRAAARNQARAEQDASIVLALTRITGENFGPDPAPWRSWWADVKGVSYDRPYRSTAKPTITAVSRTTTIASLGHGRCFAEGTPVLTAFGPRPIEALRVGDRVISADPDSGALSVRTVVAARHNPPSPTLRLTVAGESIVATPIHRFWKAGKGWVMARDLRPGDALRAADGLAVVTANERGSTVPVYNLEVAEGRSFFVGGCSVLVHDYTLARPVSRPYDAPPALADLVAPTARPAESRAGERR